MKTIINFLYHKLGFNLLLLTFLLFMIRGIKYVPELFAWGFILTSFTALLIIYIFVTYSEEETLTIKFLKKFIERDVLIGYVFIIIYIGICNGIISDLI